MFFSFHFCAAQENIGEGRFSKVFAAEHRETKRRVAVKVIDKQSLSEKERELLRTEIAILKLVHHPHIIQLENVFETPEVRSDTQRQLAR